jgi:hypothetical protein
VQVLGHPGALCLLRSESDDAALPLAALDAAQQVVHRSGQMSRDPGGRHRDALDGVGAACSVQLSHQPVEGAERCTHQQRVREDHHAQPDHQHGDLGEQRPLGDGGR